MKDNEGCFVGEQGLLLTDCEPPVTKLDGVRAKSFILSQSSLMLFKPLTSFVTGDVIDLNLFSLSSFRAFIAVVAFSFALEFVAFIMLELLLVRWRSIFSMYGTS